MFASNRKAPQYSERLYKGSARMHIETLKMFCDVASRRSFSRAADANHISQSGASQMVLQLEDRLGVKLIDRSKRPFVLTPEGDLFYRECRKLLDRYETLIEQVQNLHAEVAGRVRVASIYSVGLSYLNRYAKDFTNRNPHVDLQIEYEHPNRVYELVEGDQVDLGLVSYAKTTRSLELIPWRDEPMMAICSAQHAFASRRSLRPDELADVDFVGFDKELRIRRETDRALLEAGTTLNVVMEFDNTETIKRAVELGDGIAIVPEPTVRRELQSGSLIAIPLTGCRLVRPLGIIHRRGKDLSRAARRFVDLLLEQTQSINHRGTATLEADLSAAATVVAEQ